MIKYENKKLLIVPIILTFLIALYVTLTTNGPLSWDIYTHINYSLAYLINGLTTTDPLLNAPIGKTIGYAPLFHILLILTSSISGLSLIQSAQVFQVVFVTVAVISVVYISHKLYGSVAGCVSGMLLLASFMFTRLLLPIPETIAVIFFLWGVYFYYIAIDNENIWYVFIAIWALLAFIISNLHWIGVPVYTYRMLIYFVIPTVLLGGYAFSQLLENYKKDNNKFIYMSIVVLLLLSLISLGFSLSDESFQYSSVSTSQSKFHIAPPSAEETEVIDWFKTQNTSTNESMITNNLFFGMILSSSDVIPMHYSFDVYTSPSSRKSSSYALADENISYIVYDKSLVMNNSTDYSDLDVVYVEGDYYPVYYFTKEIDDYNFNQIQVGTKVFENNRFIVCQVQ